MLKTARFNCRAFSRKPIAKAFPLARLCAAAFGLTSLCSWGAPEAQAGGAAEKSFAFDQLGVEAQKQYAGDGIAISPTGDGASLRSLFQKLQARVTNQGLVLESLERPGQSESFRVAAVALGRAGLGSPVAALPRQGRVVTAEDSASFHRPGVTEEYRVSMDGVRQDFVIAQRPASEGELSLALEVTDARVEAAPYGAKLTLSQSGREIAYSRLRVTDADGRELAARFVVTSPVRMEIRVADAGAVYPVRIDPTYSDADWLGMEGSPGTNGSVYATAVDGSGNLYVGGNFTQLGVVSASYLAKWDGSAWSALGTGLNGEVRSLLMSGSNLYVGGAFTTAGGNAAGRIAKWDGASWTTFGSGMNGTVLAMVFAGTDMYAGGEFTTAGGTTVNYVAKWNGTLWSAMGSGTVGTTGAVRSLVMMGADLYVGGLFSHAGGTLVNNVARWNSTWTALLTGVTPGTFGAVNALVVGSDGALYAGGGFSSAGGVIVNRVGRWTGSTWAILGAPTSFGVDGEVKAMAVSATNIYVAGSFNTASGIATPGIARWSITGATWSALGAGVTGTVNALTVSGANVYVGGEFLKSGATEVNRLARWDGTSWNPVRPAGMNGSVSALAVSAANLYVGGAFTFVGGVSASRIAKWDGSNWAALGSGTSDTVKALAVVSDAEVYAGGSFVTAGGTTVNGIAKWNGSAWSALGSGISGSVLSLAVNSGSVYAGGAFATAGGVGASNIARWDGSAWNALGTGVNGDVKALASSGTNVYAGGLFTTAGGSGANYVARWDGSAWNGLGTGTTGEVAALLTFGSDVYAGGAFVSAGGNTVNHVARWNGTAWSALGTGVNERVNALARSGSYIYAAGLLTTAGGNPASRITRWNGKVWSPLGSGVNNTVAALATSSSQLYVGGVFTTAGDKTTSFIARAALPPEPEISVRGNDVEIVNEDSTPRLADLTDFGPANVAGGTVARSFAIHNLSTTAALNLPGVPKVTISGAHAADFTVTGQPSSLPIATESSSSVIIQFDPSAAGLRTAIVSMQTDDPDEDPYTFTIQGTGGEPEIAVSGNSVPIPSGSTPPTLANHTDFGYALPNSGVITRTFTIANTGNSPLTKTAASMVSITGAVANNFTVLTPPSDSIAAGGSSPFIIRFAPSVAGVQTAVIHIASDDADEADYVIEIKGIGDGPGQVSFRNAVYSINQGVLDMDLVVDRTGGSLATSVTINTNDGPASVSPPYAAGVAFTDYFDLAGQFTTLSFANEEMSKTVRVSLPLKTGTVPNRRFNVELTAINGQALLGSIPKTVVEILATDTAKPKLTLTAPKAGPVNAITPFAVDVTGVAGDPRGVISVTVKLNSGDPVAALLGDDSVPTAVPFSLSINPVDGVNTLEVVAKDLRGNTTLVTRSFTFTRRYTFTLSRVIPGDTMLTRDKIGTVTMAVTPTTAAAKLEPVAANSDPRSATIAGGASVKLTAAVKAGFAFSHWQGLPESAVIAGEVATFAMPTAPTSVTAHFVKNPFDAPAGMGNIFYGLIHADLDSEAVPSNGTQGFITATMTTKGGLSGKLFIDGLAQAFTATVYGDGSTYFTVSGKKRLTLPIGTKTVTLEYNAGEGNDTLLAIYTNGAAISEGAAKRASHTTANKVAPALLNSAAKGYYTVALPAKAQTPVVAADKYPQGSSHGTVNLTSAGLTTFAISLADGTSFTASSALIAGEVSPFLAQLATPGAAASVKGGSFSGTLAFATQTNTDVTGTDLLWFRPLVAAKTTPAAAAAATNLYTDGWPSGIKVDAIGALYNSLLSVQFSLGLAPASTVPGNGELLFSSEKLEDDVSKVLKIDFNTIIKVPANDASYTLVAAPKTGFFNGTFTPIWLELNSGPKLPTYKGVIIQKGTSKGGYGYFLSNALNDLDPVSGRVILRKPVPVVP